MRKITVQMEEHYAKLLKQSAIKMGQEGKLPQMSMHQQMSQDRLTKQEQAYQIIKSNGITNSRQLAEKMGLNSKDHARNFIQRLVRDGKVKKINKKTSSCYPYSGYTAVN